MSYHIAKNGQPAKCNATTRECPLGGEHFDSMREAMESTVAPRLDGPTLTYMPEHERQAAVARWADEGVKRYGLTKVEAELFALEAAAAPLEERQPTGAPHELGDYLERLAAAHISKRLGEATPPTITHSQLMEYRIGRANAEQQAFIEAVLEETDEPSRDEWLLNWLQEEHFNIPQKEKGFTSPY